jgi:hypothetical protein
METKKSQNLSLNIFKKKYANKFWRIFLVFKALLSENGNSTFFVKFILRILKIGHFKNVHF